MTDWADVLESRAMWAVIESECLAVLKTMPDSCIDSIVTDPPSGIAFMNAQWDTNKGGRDKWIAWLSEILVECRRVLKPGGHAFVWALPRTSHWTGMAIELAGFEVRDSMMHLFSTGFPKSLDISKAIDRRGGADIGWFGSWLKKERLRRGIKQKGLAQYFPSKTAGLTGCVSNWELGLNLPTPEQFNLLVKILDAPFESIEEIEREILETRQDSGSRQIAILGTTAHQYDITVAATDEAKQWDGWHTALKPSYEMWWLCRKPLAAPTIAQNVLQHGTGAINVDACRVSVSAADAIAMERCNTPESGRFKASRLQSGAMGRSQPGEAMDTSKGRWPPNCAFSHTPECQRVGERRVKGSNGVRGASTHIYGGGKGFTRATGEDVGYADPDGFEVVEGWECHESCPVKALEDQEPGASRFFHCFSAVNVGNPAIYVPKASTSERNKGLGGRKKRKVNDGRSTPIDNPYQRGETLRVNHHATVKPLTLMSHLVKLITPPNGIVLDCFAGSGTTGVAALRDGFRFIGIEMNPEYVSIARQRIAEDSPFFNRPREVTE